VGQFVMIPFDYETLPQQARDRVIPICVPILDRRGYPIPWEWFERGVAPVHEHLVQLAEWHLSDSWCASQIVEIALCNLFERHGSDLGEFPWRRVLREAIWVAKDLSAGGTRADRKRRARHVSVEGFEESIIDPTDYADLYYRDLFLNAVERKLAERRRIDIRDVCGLVRLGHNWSEIAARFGFSSEEVLKRRFYRVLTTTYRKLTESGIIPSS